MAKVYVFLADGFEDVEALIPIDVLRRGGVEVVTVSTTEFPLVESAHGVNIEADIQFEQADYQDADLLMLPGGMPGASNLFEHEGVCKAVCDQFAAGKKVAAICAAPAVVLAQWFSHSWVSSTERRLHATPDSTRLWQRQEQHIPATS